MTTGLIAAGVIGGSIIIGMIIGIGLGVWIGYGIGKEVEAEKWRPAGEWKKKTATTYETGETDGKTDKK